MKKNYIYILIIILFFSSCEKNKNNKVQNKSTSLDSISFYINKCDEKTISNDVKLKYADRAFYLLKNEKNTRSNRNLLYDLIVKYYSLGVWSKYKSVSNTLLGNSLESNDTINLAKSYRSLGNYYNQNQILDSAFFFFSKSEKKYKELNDFDGYSTILLKKGIIQYNNNDFSGADLSLSNAYILAKRTDDKLKIYGILNQLGLVSNKLSEYEKGINYLNQALSVVRENKLYDNQHHESICLSNIGYIKQTTKQYNEAIHYYNLSLKSSGLKNDSPILYSNIIDNMSFCKLQIKDYDRLPKLFFEALKIRDSIGDLSYSILSNNHLSEYYFAVGDELQSKRFANVSLKLARKSKLPSNVIFALKQASFVDPEKSFEYTKEYIRISDSLQIVERKNKDIFARIQLETDELKKENIDLEEKNRDILNYFMGTMLFVGVLFFMRAQRARRRELILTQAQQRASEEIYKLIITQQNKIDEGRVMEKSRIAKELHDGVLGRMFGLRLNLDGLNKRDDEPAIQERLRCLEELKIIEQDLREISHELSREKYVLINNFVAIVNSLLEDQSKVNTAELSYKIGVDIDWDLLSNTTKINLYRILQETLQNINKYAKAKNIKVEFKKDKKGNLILNIADDGIGFDVAKKSKGIGLKNIVTRTHECEGTIEIKSFIDKGSQIKITVPLDSKSIKI